MLVSTVALPALAIPLRACIDRGLSGQHTNLQTRASKFSRPVTADKLPTVPVTVPTPPVIVEPGAPPVTNHQPEQPPAHEINAGGIPRVQLANDSPPASAHNQGKMFPDTHLWIPATDRKTGQMKMTRNIWALYGPVTPSPEEDLPATEPQQSLSSIPEPKELA